MAVVATVLIVGGVAVSKISGRSGGRTFQIAAAENVVINTDATSVAAHNSPAIVRSPKDPATLAVAARIDRPFRSGGLHLSHDDGSTWADVALPAVPNSHEPFAPDIAFTGGGKLVVAFSTVPRGGAVPSGVWVAGSDDGGHTLSPPVQLTGPAAFQVRIAAGPDERLYATWLQADEAAVPESCLPCFSRTGLPIVAASSADGGATWSPPVVVSDPARARVGAATPAVAPDGSLYVLYQDFKEDRDDWENLDTPPHTGTFELVVARSSDQGATFTSASVDAELRTLERFLVFFPKHPSLTVDPDGGLYVAWQDARTGDYDVLLSRSTDGGQSWDGPVRVNDDPVKNGRHQYLPVLSASVAGRLDALYFDRRDDPRNILVGAYFATSFDRGDNWQSIPVSTQLYDSRIGPGSERKNPDPGARLGLVSDKSSAHAVWTDSRRGTLDTDKQDLFSARIVITRKS
ncbi:MAG: sialidase family protein [Acidimicrobiales bacterium]